MSARVVTLPTEEELEEFLFLKKEEKRISERLSMIRDQCKEVGSFCTERFVCTVYEQDQKRLVGLEEAAKVLGWDELDKYDLIKVVTFCIVKVTYRKEP